MMISENRKRKRHAPQSEYDDRSRPSARTAGNGMERAAWREERGIDSRNQLVQENLRLVLRVARQYTGRGLTLDDLVGEGNLGLIRAAQSFDASLGTKFSTYATYWVREAIQAALANTAGTIRLPVHISRLMSRWQRTEKILRQSRGYPPTFDEVAAAMGLDAPTQRLIAKAHRVAQLRQGAIECVDSPGASLLMLDGGTTAEETLTEREERESISLRVERLEETERTVVQLKFGMSGEPPMSFEQIGSRLGMSMAVVQKVITAAIRKLGRQREAPLSEPVRPPQLPGRLKVG